MSRRLVLDEGAFFRALDGKLPAEALEGRDRALLVLMLHRRGWTDVHIAVHTLWTTYTVARIRTRLDLPPNAEKGAVA